MAAMTQEEKSKTEEKSKGFTFNPHLCWKANVYLWDKDGILAKELPKHGFLPEDEPPYSRLAHIDPKEIITWFTKEEIISHPSVYLFLSIQQWCYDYRVCLFVSL